jgi:hypothetical protein
MKFSVRLPKKYKSSAAGIQLLRGRSLSLRTPNRSDLLTVKYYCKIIEIVPGMRATVVAICILQYFNYRSGLF